MTAALGVAFAALAASGFAIALSLAAIEAVQVERRERREAEMRANRNMADLARAALKHRA